MTKEELICNILDRLTATTACTITDEHLQEIETILLEELP